MFLLLCMQKYCPAPAKASYIILIRILQFHQYVYWCLVWTKERNTPPIIDETIKFFCFQFQMNSAAFNFRLFVISCILQICRLQYSSPATCLLCGCSHLAMEMRNASTHVVSLYLQHSMPVTPTVMMACYANQMGRCFRHFLSSVGTTKEAQDNMES